MSGVHARQGCFSPICSSRNFSIASYNYRNFIEAVRQSINDPDCPIEKENPRFRKSGLVGFGSPVVWDAWLQMNSPRRPVNRNVRFYFTEDDWRRYGRMTIKVCQQAGQRYRVLRIKENAVDVIYRDEFQVAVRPRGNSETKPLEYTLNAKQASFKKNNMAVMRILSVKGDWQGYCFVLDLPGLRCMLKLAMLAHAVRDRLRMWPSTPSGQDRMAMRACRQGNLLNTGKVEHEHRTTHIR